ncbi:hypothetical protein HY224_00585 [Candidatus Uhrbacteria bacterium]|nr:hypothetical protein [Candidatus Uhrbacteria bacterium]
MLNAFFGKKFFIAGFFLSLLLNLATWAGLLWRLKPTSEPIPLHYNVYFGPDLIGPWQQAYVIPGLGLGFLVLNLVLAYLFYRRERVLAYLLTGLTLLIETFLLIGSIMVILINL